MLKVTQIKPNMDKINPNSEKFDELYSEIWEKFTVLGGETSQRLTRNLADKEIYLGEHSQHWDTAEELGDTHPIVNYIASIDNKYADLLTAGEMPGIQYSSPSEDDESKANASAAENLLYRILDINQFQRTIHYGAVNGSMLGDTFFHCYWDPSKKMGSSKGSAMVETISPFFIRVGFAKDNWNEIEYWTSESRMTAGAIRRKYGVDVSETALSGNSAGSGGSSANAPFDETPVESSKTYLPMATVVEYHDNEKDAVLIGDTVIFTKENNGYHGLFHIRNRTAPNEPWGYPDHYNIRDANKLLNRLHGKSHEILDAHAAPIIIDKGGVLQGRRLKTRHNSVVTTLPYAPGEGLEYLQWSGNIFPVDQQMKTTTQSIYDLSEMPAAAFGSYQPGTQSGFALQVQMQPTLMRVKIKQNAEWGPNLVEMYKYLLRLVLENDKSVNLPKEVLDYDLKLRWPNPLPREDAREIQNSVALVTNKLISRETAMQDLLVDDVQVEKTRIDNETLKEADIQAEAQKKLMEAQLQTQAAAVQTQGQIQGQGETALNTPIQPGQAPEQAFPTFKEENRATPQSLGLEGGESIAPTSEGG